MGKISEQIYYIEQLDKLPSEKKVSKFSYDKILNENDVLKKTLDYLVQFKGLPELNKLLETSKNSGMPTDEHWVLALCSVNLIEAAVNKKLEDLNEDTKGKIKSKLNKLDKMMKQKEGKDVSKLLPLALYSGIRNKLDHESHANRVTPREAKQISNIVIELINELFP